MKRLLAAAILLSTSSEAFADEANDATLAAEQASTTEGRNSQAGGDPWVVSSSSALFTRPSLSEAFKLSNDTDSKGNSTYQIATGLSALNGPTNLWTDGLQLALAGDPTTEILSVGVKWNIDFKDVRLLSDSEVAQIQNAADAPDSAFTKCIAGKPPTPELLKQCGPKEDDDIDKGIKNATQWKPAFALAAGTGYNFQSKAADKTNGTLSAEIAGGAGPTTLALTGNLEFDRNPSTDMTITGYQEFAGGGLQVSDTLKEFTLAVGGKLLGCLTNCGSKSSDTKASIELSYAIDKKTKVGGAIKWDGTGTHLGDTFGALSISYSFGPSAPKK